MLLATISKFLDKLGVPELYGQECRQDKMLYMRLYLVEFSWTWYVCEVEIREDDILFWGFVQGDFGEWGYFTLSELASAGLEIVIDPDFVPMTFSEAKDIYNLDY